MSPNKIRRLQFVLMAEYCEVNTPKGVAETCSCGLTTGRSLLKMEVTRVKTKYMKAMQNKYDNLIKSQQTVRGIINGY